MVHLEVQGFQGDWLGASFSISFSFEILMSCNDNVEDNFEDFWKIFDEFTQIDMFTFSITDIFKLCPAIKAFRVGFCKLVIQIIQKPGLCYKFQLFNHCIFETWCSRPLIFKTKQFAVAKSFSFFTLGCNQKE